MKKIFNKIELKGLLIPIGLVIMQSVFYFLSKLIQGSPNLIGGVIDEKIQFCNLFIIPYCIWHLMIFIIPYIYYKKDKIILTKYIVSYIICAFIAGIIFIAYPTTVIRPALENNSLLNIFTNIIYYIDSPALNCFPSMHCAICMLFILTCIKTKNTGKKFKIFTILMSILIMISTLYTKQHVFVDLVSGDILMTIVYIIVSKTNLLFNYTKKLLKL